MKIVTAGVFNLLGNTTGIYIRLTTAPPGKIKTLRLSATFYSSLAIMYHRATEFTVHLNIGEWSKRGDIQSRPSVSGVFDSRFPAVAGALTSFLTNN